MKEILITSSVLIAVLLVLRVIFAKKVSRVLIYSAWALVALRLLIPVQIGELNFSVLTAAQPVIEAVDERVEDAILGTAPEKSYEYHIQHYIEKDPSVFIPEVQEQIQQEISQGTQTREEIFEKIQQEFPEQEILTPEGQETVQMLVGIGNATLLHNADTLVNTVWFVSIAVMAVWFTVVNLRHSRMLRKNREKLDCESPIPVYVSERVGSPCLVGLFRPVIYLTPACAASEQTQRHVLTHELTHYRHMDHIWSVVRCVCLCVYWFDPLVWVAAWFSRRDCELACDEGALKRLGEEERIAYGKSLLDVVSHASTPAHLMETATAMNETKKQLKERVNFIVKKPKISLIAAICMVLVCAIVAGCAAAGPSVSSAGSSDSSDNWERVKMQIQEDAVAFFSTETDTCQPEDVFLELVSQVDNTYVMFVNMPGWYYLAVITKVEIGGLVFQYSSSQEMYAYRDGSFLNLKEAYESGWLSDGQLLTVWMDYVTYKRQYPQTNNPNLQQPTQSTPADDPTPMRWIQLLTSVKQGERVMAELVYDDYWNLKEVNECKIETNATRRTMTVYSSKNGSVIEEYQYDAAGNLTRYQDHDVVHPFVMECLYDAARNLLKVIYTYENNPNMNGHRMEVVYTYDENGRKESRCAYTYTLDSAGQEVSNIEEKTFYSYDAMGNLIQEEWYSGNGEKLEHMIYTFDAKLRAERLDHFVRYDTPEGKIDILQTIHIYYYNAEGNVIRHEQYDPESHRLTYVETYDYQTVQVPEDFFGPTYINYTDREVIFRQDGQNTETPIIPQPEPNPTDPTEPIEPTRPEESPKPTEPDHNDQPTKPLDAVFNTENIVRITFYAYYGGGKGSDVPAENMEEIINWLNSFAVGKKAPEVLPPGTGTWQVEIEYADGTVVKRSLDTITIDGVIYYLDSDPQPEILEKIFSMASL